MKNNINLKKGDIVIPNFNKEQLESLEAKIELYTLFGMDEVVDLYNNTKTNLNKRCKVLSVINGVLSDNKKVYVECNGAEALYPIECLTLVHDTEEESNNQKATSEKLNVKNPNVNMIVAYYDDKIEIDYCSGKNKYEHLSIDQSKEDKNYNDLVARVHSVALDILNTKLYKENLEYLKAIQNYNKKWFEDNNINIELFEKLASSELLNQNVSGFDNVNNILLDVAKAITGNEDLSKKFKYNKTLYKVERMLKGKKKAVGITGILGALGAGAIIKPFFSNGNGKYVINGTNLSDDEILDKLNFTNGMKDDVIGETLKKNFKMPRYINVKNKNGYF